MATSDEGNRIMKSISSVQFSSVNQSCPTCCDPVDCKEIQPVKITKEIIPEYSLEGLILWPPDTKSQLIRIEPDTGKDWGQEEKGMTEDEMVGWHHRHNGHGFGWTLGVGDGQGGLAYCGSWGCKELDTTEWLNWPEHYKVDGVALPIWQVSELRSYS